jgi:hypothetical protein
MILLVFHLDSNVSRAQTKQLIFFSQTNINTKRLSVFLVFSATVFWYQYIHHASNCQHGLSVSFFLIPFLPPVLPTTLY